jgi:hypothetical protein
MYAIVSRAYSRPNTSHFSFTFSWSGPETYHNFEICGVIITVLVTISLTLRSSSEEILPNVVHELAHHTCWVNTAPRENRRSSIHIFYPAMSHFNVSSYSKTARQDAEEIKCSLDKRLLSWNHLISFGPGCSLGRFWSTTCFSFRSRFSN